MIPYSWTTAAIGIFIGAVILYMVRKNYLHIPYAVWWIVVAIASVVLGLFPRLVDAVALRLGVHYPPILLITVILGLILVKILSMDIERSKQEQKIREIIQRLAVFEAEKEEAQNQEVEE